MQDIFIYCVYIIELSITHNRQLRTVNLCHIPTPSLKVTILCTSSHSPQFTQRWYTRFMLWSKQCLNEYVSGHVSGPDVLAARCSQAHRPGAQNDAWCLCLVSEWNTGFLTSSPAPWLSLYNTVCDDSVPSPVNNNSVLPPLPLPPMPSILLQCLTA